MFPHETHMKRTLFEGKLGWKIEPRSIKIGIEHEMKKERHLGGVLEHLGGILEASWKRLGSSGRRHGGSWRRLGVSWRRLGGHVELS